MPTTPISHQPKHTKNPFIAETLSYLKEVSRFKRVTAYSPGSFVDGETGEMLKVFDVKRNGHLIDVQPFVKCFIYGNTSFLKEFADMPRYAQQVLLYILDKVERDKDEVFFSLKECKTFTKYPSVQSIYNGLGYLAEKGFIARSEADCKYFINTSRFFNGNRLKIIPFVPFRSNPASENNSDNFQG